MLVIVCNICNLHVGAAQQWYSGNIHCVQALWGFGADTH